MNIDYIKTIDTWFEIYDEDDKNGLLLTTRENGNVGDEEYSEVDYSEAKRVKDIILKENPHLIINIVGVDEWVHIDIREKVKDKFRYYFIKRDENGNGFTETFDTIDDLIKKYDSWIEVDWERVRIEVDKIDSYPLNTFTGWFQSYDILLSKANSKGNDWGYSFYLKKSKYNSDY